MKKIIKYLFLAMVVITALSVVWYAFIASDETKFEMEIDALETKITEAESIEDLNQLYSELEVLQQKDTLNLFTEKFETIKTERPELETKIKKAAESNMPAGAYLYAKELVKAQLKAPSTAKFASFIKGEAKVGQYDNGNYQVIMWVDAQNSFGAMLRKTYQVDLKPVNNSWQLVKIVELK
ncbi:hypothetical protein [uncultured Draconibacterium sp.]|uniref:hypothetical protein n=1 Tax=uncultured Draconibacterium sp. TaxID=1573823 RepID=UPI003261115D